MILGEFGMILGEFWDAPGRVLHRRRERRRVKAQTTLQPSATKAKQSKPKQRKATQSKVKQRGGRSSWG